MSTFLFESALTNKELSRTDLPKKIDAKIEKLIQLCHDLNEVPDDDNESIDKLNDKIDELDAEIETSIYEFTPDQEQSKSETKEEIPLTETEEIPQESQGSSNAVATVGVLAGIGLAIWGITKFMGGKK